MNRARIFVRSGLTFAAVVADGGAVACKGTETAKSATTPNAMIVGPENIAVVKAEQIRSGPAVSGTLQPEQMVDQCLDLLGPVEVGDDTKKELTDQVKKWGQMRWDNAAAAAESTKRAGELLQLIVATREYQFA